jgi:hypothetical protein
MAAIQKDTPEHPEYTDLTSIDKFQMFKKGHKHQGFTTSKINEGQITPGNRNRSPLGFQELDIGIEHSARHGLTSILKLVFYSFHSSYFSNSALKERPSFVVSGDPKSQAHLPIS